MDYESSSLVALLGIPKILGDICINIIGKNGTAKWYRYYMSSTTRSIVIIEPFFVDN